MFIEIKHIDYSYNDKVYVQLIDDHFKENFIINDDNNIMDSKIMNVINIYAKRKYYIGKNLALFIVWYSGMVDDYFVNLIISKQNSYGALVINNWSEIEKERDDYLKLLEIWD